MRFRYHSLSECTITMGPHSGGNVQYIQYMQPLYDDRTETSSSCYSRTYVYAEARLLRGVRSVEENRFPSRGAEEKTTKGVVCDAGLYMP
jgi:hypothetical protein